jgi:hypothetical protein
MKITTVRLIIVSRYFEVCTVPFVTILFDSNKSSQIKCRHILLNSVLFVQVHHEVASEK